MKASQSPVEELAGLNISKQENKKNSNSTADRNQQKFLIKVCNRSTKSNILYHDPIFLQLPKDEKLKIIDAYHKIISDSNYENQTKRIVFKYSKPIVPREGVTFNGYLDVDWKPEDPENPEEQDKNKIFDDFASSSSTNSRPRRHVKRQTYTELLDSDDEDKTIDSDKRLPLKKPRTMDFSSSDEEIKWVNRPRKNAKPPLISALGFNDRTNKIFDSLKTQDDKKNKINTSKLSLHKYGSHSESSDSELEQVFCQKKYNVSATVHKEQTLASTSCSSKTTSPARPTRRAPVRTSTSNNKYSSIAHVVPSTSKQIESFVTTALNLDMIACPICTKPFPKTEIEAHAAKCEQFQDSPTSEVCVICNKCFPESEITMHRIDCMRPLIEQSNEIPTTSFLCEVCQKYLVDVDEIDHASKCIAKVRKDCK